jgi:hypothetical protein
LVALTDSFFLVRIDGRIELRSGDMRRVCECYGSLRAEVGLRRSSARRHAGSELQPSSSSLRRNPAISAWLSSLRVAATNAPRRLVRSCCCARTENSRGDHVCSRVRRRSELFSLRLRSQAHCLRPSGIRRYRYSRPSGRRSCRARELAATTIGLDLAKQFSGSRH